MAVHPDLPSQAHKVAHLLEQAKATACLGDVAVLCRDKANRDLGARPLASAEKSTT